MNFTETTAISMLKEGHQPSVIAKKTGLSQTWIESKARGLGLKPLTVEGVK